MICLYNFGKRIVGARRLRFLGPHMVDRLLDHGNNILCVDNLSAGTKRNIERLYSHPRFEFIRDDITFPPYVEIDEIYNLACLASPVPYQSYPVHFRLNLVTI
jgi:UDP-glucuronate decarboxylase